MKRRRRKLNSEKDTPAFMAGAKAGGLGVADDGADLGVPVRIDRAGIGADLTVTFFKILKSACFV